MGCSWATVVLVPDFNKVHGHSGSCRSSHKLCCTCRSDVRPAHEAYCGVHLPEHFDAFFLGEGSSILSATSISFSAPRISLSILGVERSAKESTECCVQAGGCSAQCTHLPCKRPARAVLTLILAE